MVDSTLIALIDMFSHNTGAAFGSPFLLSLKTVVGC